MRHHVKMYEFVLETAKAGRPLPLLEEFDVEAPDDVDKARVVVGQTAVKRSGRRLHGLSSLAGGGFSVIVVRDEMKHAVGAVIK